MSSPLGSRPSSPVGCNSNTNPTSKAYKPTTEISQQRVELKLDIKVLDKDHWPQWKEVRLDALKKYPHAFVSSYEEVKDKPNEFFQDKVQSTKSSRMYGAFVDGKLVAIGGFSRDERQKENHRGHISGMYTKPEFSSKGLGCQLLRKMIEDARTEKIEILFLSCVSNNKHALALYEGHGFKTFGTEPRAIKIGNEYFDMQLMSLTL